MSLVRRKTSYAIWAQSDQHLFVRSLDRDFSAYISGSHKRTRSQCKKVYIFPNFDEKIPNVRGKFPKSDSVFMNIAILSKACRLWILPALTISTYANQVETNCYMSKYQNKHLTKWWKFPIWSDMSLFFSKGQVPDPFSKGSEKSLLDWIWSL